ncbi:5-oxoprolinase subunit C family protein [Desmospora profundinema]|uniref:Antagonist of KipI n=1 Tax=Desmospora profundinema TaxID=1571184 RepID=A0ABU1ITL2_9BACL|nr:biotin-dependent carboxyltransferase family protein [Desmospora profundinema]MDR6227529.1 antagonist of KipI [Desmospora profundinema]
MKPALIVQKPGLLTTVQDEGRPGYQAYGMGVSGAMDPFALQVGNLLVGNLRGEAALEITMSGPELEWRRDAWIALTGADLSPTLDGVPLPLWKTVSVKAGQVLRFGGPRQGVRSYLAVAGGIEVKRVMGSKSTYLKGRVGGFHGRPLKKGDEVAVGDPRLSGERLAGRALAGGERPSYRRESRLRTVEGPQADAFTAEGIRCFYSQSYTVTPQSDRMGCRLQGSAIQHRGSADIISDAIPPGAVQVPANGQPIILMADRQTTGGYTKIATVLSVDLPLVAQAAVGHRFTFEQMTVEEAGRLAVEQERFLRQLEAHNR